MALFALDHRRNAVEVGHDLVVALFQFSRAGFIGVRTDFFQGVGRLGTKDHQLVLGFLQVHSYYL